MPRYVALLRGINLGGHRVKMDDLRRHFETLGVRKVETFIASGNVIFESPAKADALEGKIAAHLEKALGYAVPTFVRTDAELAAVAVHRAFDDMNEHNVYVGFLDEKPSKVSEAALMKHQSKMDEFHVHRREVYWLCRTARSSESPFFKVGLDKALGMTLTVRNMNTVQNIVEKYPCKS